MRNPAILLVTTFALASTSACLEKFGADDVSFDQWCGETLCHWEVDEGKIEKVATWHRSDAAVRLVGGEAQISQTQKSFQGDCIQFELIANVEARTRTTLQLDFNADGTVDLVQALPTDPWEPEVFFVRAPARYHGVRFILHKAAPGEAIIAQMGASNLSGSECAGAPLALGAQNEGAACAGDGDCAEGTCTAGTCSECATDDDCTGEDACALVDYPSSQQRRCVAPKQLDPRELGQPCSRDSQCSQGYACAATDDALTTRCGMACRGPKDDSCRAGTRCAELLVYFDADWNAETAHVCLEASDCANSPFEECLDPDGEVFEP